MAKACAIHDVATERFPHGARARYTRGCRCALCRAANTQYARECAERAKERATVTAARPPATGDRPPCVGVNGQPCPAGRRLYRNSVGDICADCRVRKAYFGLVSSEKARAHLLELAAAGVGKVAVYEACDVPLSTLHDIRIGRRPRIVSETERRILEVDAGALKDGALVPAAETWRLIDEMRALGIPKYRLAQMLGSKANRNRPSLQLRREFVELKTAARVRKLHRDIAAQLLRQTELREQFEEATELGAEFFAKDSFSFFSRASATKAPTDQAPRAVRKAQAAIARPFT